MVKVRVLLVDDDALVRAGLRMILASSEDLEVVGEAVDGTDAMLARLADGSAAGGVLVKCLKPQQDRRLDMPAVGPATIAAARAAFAAL